MAALLAGIVSRVYVMQILEDQQLLTTERTRRLILKIIMEGFLTDSESEDAWEKKLTEAMHEQDGEDVNSMLWRILTSQVQPIPLLRHHAHLECMKQKKRMTRSPDEDAVHI